MKQIDMTRDGRCYRVEIPDDADDRDAEFGIIIGPPEDLVDLLNLPEPYATRLHNELHRRHLWNYKEIAKRSNILMGVLQSVFKIDVQILMNGYRQAEVSGFIHRKEASDE